MSKKILRKNVKSLKKLLLSVLSSDDIQEFATRFRIKVFFFYFQRNLNNYYCRKNNVTLLEIKVLCV